VLLQIKIVEVILIFVVIISQVFAGAVRESHDVTVELHSNMRIAVVYLD